MEFIIIDGRRMTSIEAAHEYLAKTLRLPPYYGRNLDALHDVLTERADPVGIVIVNEALLHEHRQAASGSCIPPCSPAPVRCRTTATICR